MKNFIFSKGFFLMALSMGLLFFNSCSKEDVSTPDTDTDTFEQEFGKFTKEITISDESGENTAVLRVGSDDKSILDMWQPENYQLVPILEGQNPEDIIRTVDSTTEEEYLQEADASNLEAENSDEYSVAGKTSTMIISKNLQPGVKNIGFISISPYPEDLRGWSYDTHYSQAGGNYMWCIIKGHNAWKRGYYQIHYKENSSYSPWTKIKTNIFNFTWTKIGNNDTAIEYRNPCYQWKAQRKYKSGSVTISFE